MGQSDRVQQTHTYEVSNRDIITLTRVRAMKQEIKITEQKRAELLGIYRRALRASEGPVRARRDEVDLEAVRAELAAQDAEYLRILADNAQAIRDANDILRGIEYDDMRVFVALLYESGETHKNIWARLNMSRRVFEKLRKLVEEAPDMASVPWPEKWLLKTGCVDV